MRGLRNNKRAVELSLQKLGELILAIIVLVIITSGIIKCSQNPDVILTPSMALEIEKCENTNWCNIEKCTEEMAESDRCSENEMNRWEMWERYFEQCNSDIDDEKKKDLGCYGEAHKKFRCENSDVSEGENLECDEIRSGGDEVGEGDEGYEEGFSCPYKSGRKYECKCENCKDLRKNNLVACKTSNTNCGVVPELENRLVNLFTEMNKKNVKLQVTEGWPPKVAHSSGCHYDGTCVDVNFIEPNRHATPENIRTFIDLAKKEGLKAVYEVGKWSERGRLIRDGGRNSITFRGSPDGEIIVVEGVTPHFSVYLR